MNAHFVIFTALLAIALAAPTWPYSELKKKLSPEQLQQAQKIIRDSADKPKTELKAGLADFIKTLPQDLQDLARQEKERLDDLVKAAREKVQTLSPEAQKVYKQFADIHNDQSLSIREAGKKIKEVFKNADRTALKELKDANLFNMKNEIIPENISMMNF